MGCGESCVKYILFFSNLFFFLGGLALVVMGVISYLRIDVLPDVLKENWNLAPIFTIVLGSVVFVIAFCGCCGSVSENSCMLVTYAVFMIVLMIAKIALATLIFVNLDSFVEQVPIALNAAFSQSNNLEPFHDIESTFRCCGTTGASAYGANTLPSSCCDSGTDGTCTLDNAFAGCNTVISDLLRTFGLAIGIISVGIVSIELVAVVFSLCLANYVRNYSRRARY